MYNYYSSPTVSNCIFSGNVATSDGGGIYYFDMSSSTVRNCTFSGNLAANSGGGIFFNSSSPRVANSIFWGNAASSEGNEIHTVYSANPRFRYCDIAGSGGSGPDWNGSFGIDGGGNIDVDPLFADPSARDFHLQSRAGRFSARPGGPLWVFDTHTSPCIDTGDPATAVGFEEQDNGHRINIGAFGGTHQASKSSNIPGDANHDGHVNLLDLALVADHWLQ